jgi:hypothetical protein
MLETAKMDLALTVGVGAVLMKVIGKMAEKTGRVKKLGMMVPDMLVATKMANGMDMVPLLGKMGANIKASGKMANGMVKELIFRMTGAAMKASGKWVSSTVRVPYIYRMVAYKLAYGKMAITLALNQLQTCRQWRVNPLKRNLKNPKLPFTNNALL